MNIDASSNLGTSKMNSTTQQEAREVIRPLVDVFIKMEIKRLVSLSQSMASADKIIAKIWPSLDPELIVKLASADADFLICSDAIPDCIVTVVQDEFLKIEHPSLIELAKGNNYARGEKLKKIVQGVVKARLQTIRDLGDQLFEEIQHDRLGCPKSIRSRVIQLLNNRCIKELVELEKNGSSADETGAKRRLKILTALSISDATGQNIVNALRRIGEGRTAGLPYVLKYLAVDRKPEQPTLPCDKPATSSCITADLERLIPEASPLKHALQSYLEHGGIISRFLNTVGNVAEGLEDQFADLPLYVPTGSGILFPKEDVLELHREKRYALPDGIVCAVALTILLESILRQIQASLGIAGSLNLRPKELIGRLDAEVHFSAETKNRLDVIFGTSQIALRDAVAHGVFIADDEQSIAEIVGGLTEAVELIATDLANAGKLADFYAGRTWSQNYTLEQVHENTFREQFEGSNMIHQKDILAIRKHAFLVFRALIPDKASICRASCLIWPNLGEGRPLNGDRSAEFVGVIGALISIEELFRAAQEVYGQRVLWPMSQSEGTIRCQLSMLDDQANGLLAPANIRSLFGSQAVSADFQKCIHAVRALRDNVLHGGWGGLSLPKVCYLHLIVKLIFTICTTIGFEASGNPVPVNARTV